MGLIRSGVHCASLGLLSMLLSAGVGQAQNAPGITWRHGVIEPKGDAGFVMMAAKRDFAKRQGLAIEVLSLKSDAIGLKALLAGDLDSYEGAPGNAIVAASRGADVKIVGCAWPQLVHGIFVRPGIGNVADLKGHKVAVSAPGAMPDLLVRAALEQHNLTIADVQLANLGGDLDRYKALAAGVVDAAVISTEYQPVMEKNITMLGAARDVMPNFVRGCFMTSGKALASRRDDVVHFVAAEIGGFRYALAHRDEALSLTREINSMKAEDPRPGYIFDQVKKHKDLDPEASIPVDKLVWLQDLLVRTGSISKPVDITTMVDASVRADAASKAER